MSLHHIVLGALKRHVIDKRPPDILIGGADDPYMRRWWVIPRNRWFNVYLHHFLRSDDDEALHDHPWWNLSWILRGRYLEIVPVNQREPSGESRVRFRMASDFAFRKASFAHRVQLLNIWPPHVRPMPRACWTLFITGPRIREWGFHCPKGWKHWKDFTAFQKTGNGNEVGAGCGEP